MAEAQRQADAMATADKLSHEVRGSLTERLDREGFEKSAAVENVSAGYDTLSEVFSGWRQSPPHNANMLARGMRRMGIAAAYNPKTRYKVSGADAGELTARGPLIPGVQVQPELARCLDDCSLAPRQGAD